MRRYRVASILVVPLSLVVLACGGGSAANPPFVTGSRTPAAMPTVAASATQTAIPPGTPGVATEAVGTVAAPTDTPSPATSEAPPDLTIFRNFIYPIKGGCLPQGDQLMPGAPRPYRNGITEGMDFYQSDNCTPIGKGTPVLAAKDGVVIRVDRNYQDLTQAEMDRLQQRIDAGGGNDADVLDVFRGRQVWVDHGNGIVTRYAHLDAVADTLNVGDTVVQGEVIAYVGESGTPESLTNPGTEEHLHFELRTNDTYLGQGLPPAEVRALYEKLFEPLP
ncbi:MAG: peptidoglycan DD-metalloendopeptidase family protein [Chloroflexi bacterium]|nr:peptidoglycan DD-metalloendopeptidase family protein [Chloroflexota bacterium]